MVLANNKSPSEALFTYLQSVDNKACPAKLKDYFRTEIEVFVHYKAHNEFNNPGITPTLVQFRHSSSWLR